MNHDHDTVPGQLADIRKRLDVGDRRMGGIERRLEENTAITMQVKDLLDIQNTARVGFKAAWGVGKFVAWAGAAAGGAAAIWALITHGPRP